MKKKVSIVIPCMNEEESLSLLTEKVQKVMLESYSSEEFEMIFIDDGSTDASKGVIRNITQAYSNVSAIFFRKNFGKSSALAAGFKKAKGEIVVTMDADLQDEPSEIPRFINKIEEGHDLVSGWKKVRNDPIEKVFMSRIFNKVVSKMTGVQLHDFNCGFKAYKSWCIKEIFVHGNFHRYLPVLIEKEGGIITEIPVQHNKRQWGKSKYGINRYLHGVMDLITVTLITRFFDRPMYFFGFIGVPMLLLGAMVCGYLVAGHFAWVLFGMKQYELLNRPLLTIGIGLIGFGLNITFAGALAEMIMQVNKKEAQRNIYQVSEVIEAGSTGEEKKSVA